MAKRPEESDGREVPEGRRKPVVTAPRARGGKATTASKEASQLRLSFETAENPRGAAVQAKADQAARSRNTVPKSKRTSGSGAPAMTMEEVADDENLRRAFEEVARNKGAAGPDGQGIDQVREQLGEVLPRIKRELLEGRYRPGMIRRVWIPKLASVALAYRTWWTGWYSRPCTKCSVPITNRPSTMQAMASGLDGAVTQRLPRPSST